MTTSKLTLQISSDNQVCNIPECNRNFYAKGFCRLHYDRVRKTGKADSPFTEICTVDGCCKPHYGQGFCQAHYSQERKRQLESDPLFQCLIPNCGKFRLSEKYCQTHHKRLKKFGSPYSNGKPPVEERFWSKVNKDTDNGCWEWTGLLNDNGYGRFSFEGKPQRAHRISWFLTYGSFPKLHLLHSCDNPLCVNPKHLREGTDLDNMQDRSNRGRAARKLNEEKVRKIRKLFSENKASSDIAKMFEVSPGVIKAIKAGKIWKHVL